MICDQRRDLSWRLFHMHLRKKFILLFLDRLSYSYQLGLSHSVQFSLVTQSCPTLQSHVLQHTGPPCPSPTPRVHPNSCPLSQWCLPVISPSVVRFSSCPQSFLAWGSFQMSQCFASRGQSIGASTSAWVLPMNTQDWFPWGWTVWISLQSKQLSRVFSNTTVNPLLLNWILWCDGRGSALEYSITIWLIISLLVALALKRGRLWPAH